jgi:hypothetical protein
MNTEQIAAAIYDQTVPDWPVEMDFYRDLARPRAQLVISSREMIWVAGAMQPRDNRGGNAVHADRSAVLGV